MGGNHCQWLARRGGQRSGGLGQRKVQSLGVTLRLPHTLIHTLISRLFLLYWCIWRTVKRTIMGSGSRPLYFHIWANRKCGNSSGRIMKTKEGLGDTAGKEHDCSVSPGGAGLYGDFQKNSSVDQHRQILLQEKRAKRDRTKWSWDDGQQTEC